LLCGVHSSKGCIRLRHTLNNMHLASLHLNVPASADNRGQVHSHHGLLHQPA
jgi:hypothetical protein